MIIRKIYKYLNNTGSNGWWANYKRYIFEENTNDVELLKFLWKVRNVEDINEISWTEDWNKDQIYVVNKRDPWYPSWKGADIYEFNEELINEANRRIEKLQKYTYIPKATEVRCSLDIYKMWDSSWEEYQEMIEDYY